MTYSFWHSGVLIGESDLEDRSDHPGQKGGIFRPTAYGLEILPRLTGFLSAGHALKTHLEANGLSAEEMRLVTDYVTIGTYAAPSAVTNLKL